MPLIYALNHATWSEKRNIINLVKNHSENPKKVTEVIDFVKKSGGIAYTTQVMKRFVEEANEIIKKLSLRAYEADYKIMIIWMPEKMHNSAANKIL